MHRIASEWEVVRWTASWPWPPDPAFTEQRMSSDQPSQGLFATVLRGADIIGLASVAEGVLGYMFARSASGRGYATEASEALVDLAFGTTDWPEVKAGVFLGNNASLRVLAKLGFHETAPSREYCRARGAQVDGIDLALTREDWLARSRSV